jgi:multiple sugar transport system substrate-binding protein
MRRRDALAGLAALSLAHAGGCSRRGAGDGDERPPGKVRLVFKHQPLWGDPAAFRGILQQFEREHGDVEVVTEPLPNASDVVHQFFLTALEGGARDFDVFVVDVVWVPEFARAGWIADLSQAFPPAVLERDWLRGAAEAVIVDQKTFAVPWYIDVGVLYRRSDLVPEAPRTYADLRLRRQAPGFFGMVWQGRQYEGLVCNVYEAIWGHGGETMQGGRVLLDTPEARAALSYLHSLVSESFSPRWVTSMAEEEARLLFQQGNVLYMRNWPYAFAEAQRPGSAVAGRVALSALPTLDGRPGSGVLGGYQLALNAHTPVYKRAVAEAFIAHLTSQETNVALALAYGRNPPRRAAYQDERLVAGAPFVASLLPMVEGARPRPVTPYYPMISDALQGEFSAAVTGIRSPAEALGRAQRLVDHIMSEGS